MRCGIENTVAWPGAGQWPLKIIKYGDLKALYENIKEHPLLAAGGLLVAKHGGADELAAGGKAAEKTGIKHAAEDVANNPIESNYVLFNKTHVDSLPKPKGDGPNGGLLQSHHGLQQQWAKENLGTYGYDPDLAPTITLETGKGLPHTIISQAQNARRNTRIAEGQAKWGSSLQDELGYIVSDMNAAGFQKSTIQNVLEQQYNMLDKLNVPYQKLDH